MKPLRLGTRGSRLALRQAESVARLIAERLPGVRVELVPVRTTGDAHRGPLTALGPTVGVFVKELQEALLRGEIDLAVHSAKDLPTASPEGLVVAAYPLRADPRDALCGGRSLAELPPGAAVGTSSPRRAAQLRAARPDLNIVPLRGNVDTRLERVAGGELDAAVLAAAGLERLGLADRIREMLDPDTVCPAPAQGALAVEARAGDEEALAVARALDDARVRRAVQAERSVLAALGGGCFLPLGALAEPAEPDGGDAPGSLPAPDGPLAGREPRLRLRAALAGPRSGAVVRVGAFSEPGEPPEAFGARVARALLERGAGPLLEEARASWGP
ncbi:MAG: hydroxymethylbilane synthase [Firmicutes bacterium]|nr:hydroxymethylbilane synthase [Bacillota bacterium]